jgi:uncharacterized protein (DUF983 family)
MIGRLIAVTRFCCPVCGKGALFEGLLRVAEKCSVCHQSFANHEQGDGPAFLAMTLVGFIITFAASWVEMVFAPPYFLHAVLWLPLCFALCLYFFRFLKALIITAQHRHGRLSWRRCAGILVMRNPFCSVIGLHTTLSFITRDYTI